MNTTNQGAIIEIIVRRKGLTALDLANELKISRRTVYILFSSQVIRKETIIQIGKIIGYDFPEILSSGGAADDCVNINTPHQDRG